MGSYLEQLELRLNTKPIILYFEKTIDAKRNLRTHGYHSSVGLTPRQVFMDVQPDFVHLQWRSVGRSSDDFYTLRNKDERLSLSIFRLAPSQKDYIVAVYGNPKNVEIVSNVLGTRITPVKRPIDNKPIEFCIRYANARQAQLNQEGHKFWMVSDWAERARPYWDRLKIDGEDPVLEEELGRDMSESGLGDALVKRAATLREETDVYQVVVDLAALYASPRALLKFMRKQQELIKEGRLLTINTSVEEISGLAADLEALLPK